MGSLSGDGESTSETGLKKAESGIDPVKVEEGKKGVTETEQPADIRNLYVTVYAFNMFTITDGAIRLIVLFHANSLGFSPLDIAILFTLYEFMGMITNMFGGIAGNRYGLKCTMLTSLILQLVGLALLALIEPIFGELNEETSGSTKSGAIAYITFCQALSGVSKDFMKLSCKSMPKLVTKANAEDKLFKLVAWVTGWKNALKGFGTILGAVLVQFIGFTAAIYTLIAIIIVIFPAPLFYMTPGIGKSLKRPVASLDVFKKPWNINILSAARFFLFGSRDVWFEIAAPIFLRDILGWEEYQVGLFMGGFIILYGQVQKDTSRMYKAAKKDKEGNLKKSRRPKCFQGVPKRQHVPNWAWANGIEILLLGIILQPIYKQYLDSEDELISDPNSTDVQDRFEKYRNVLAGVLLTGLFLFGFLFAVNSAIHSYLIVSYAGKDKVTMDIGFYYMANAGGRLVGTILSGWIFQETQDKWGLSVCLWVSAAFMFVAAVISYALKDKAEPEPKKQARVIEADDAASRHSVNVS
mmetsp:Transcript_21729/g.26353  ORF Transcript_21729/g.26353 Transcript_21729/m.26353 type:complete len:525 (+) Transcript_21729:228-1802(+)|eukprot:CAMPEP_0204832560 /NCGR_PEP_ID=MMETSP1346-20131115/14174_1 /ASSEMBLY_ACC=CAM_ASM_000771 /TAXON_ID=215587 /ORGANISM="Aplanochytrium stocchinoi, Strain GSBS06" /LENGTH=524 /DNA_ID=CAMNT_0051964471 /DNA_START=163 /DNA_END=1737 /DNA_ORIENTATION=-